MIAAPSAPSTPPEKSQFRRPTAMGRIAVTVRRAHLESKSVGCDSLRMSTEDSIKKITAAEARALLPELESSGLPLAEFARQRNVSRVPLYNARRAARLAASELSREKFARLTVRDSASERTSAASGSSIVVELRNGLCLRVPSGFDDANLRRVLAVARSC